MGNIVGLVIHRSDERERDFFEAAWLVGQTIRRIEPSEVLARHLETCLLRHGPAAADGFLWGIGHE